MLSHGIQVLSSNSFLLCRQTFVNASLLFSVACSGLKSMWYFSSVHRLQIPEMGEKGWACPIIFQSILKFSFLSFSSQMCKLSVVSCLYFSFFIAFLWLPSLDLKVLDVNPIYVSSELFDLTFAIFKRVGTPPLLPRLLSDSHSLYQFIKSRACNSGP